MQGNEISKNALQIFDNPEFGEIRTLEIDGDPWFVGRDMASALGYKKPYDAVINHVDKDDTLKQGIMDNLGRNQQTILINESGMYALIIMSDLPSAKKFKHWITREVIPSLRKTGSYNLPPLSTNEMMLQIAQNAVELERQLKAQNEEISILKESNIRTEQKLDTAISIFAKPTGTWKDGMELAIREMTGEGGWSAPKLKSKLYQELEITTSCDLGNRQLRMRKRLKKQGATYREQMAVTKLDIISKDKQLRTVFESIVRNYQAIYGLENINVNKEQEELTMKDCEAVENGLKSLGYKEITDIKYEPCGYLRDTIILDGEVLGIWDYQKNTFVD